MLSNIPKAKLNKISKFIAVVWLSAFIYFVFQTNIIGPYQDDWNNMYFLKAITEGKANLGLLFERFYGAHTPALARILFSVEYFVFNGSAIFTKLVAMTTIGLTLFIFWRNISKITGLTSNEKILLTLFVFLIVFSCPQLSAFNYPWAAFQHVCAVFFASLAFHLFAKDIIAHQQISWQRLALCFLLGIIANLFTGIGLFCLGSLLLGLLIFKAPRSYIIIYTATLVVTAYLFRPDDIILRVTDSTDLAYRFTAEEFLKKAGTSPSSFFPNYFIYVLAYLGAILENISLNASLLFGSALLCLLLFISTKLLFNKRADLLFFQLILFMAGAHVIFSALGRYQSNDWQFIRYYSIYCWLLCAGGILIFATNKKTGLWICIGIIAISIPTGYTQLRKELGYSYNAKKADINMINNSFPHLSYTKTPFPLGVLGFNPYVFHEFQKSRHWGIYRFPFNPDIPTLGSDTCEVKKLKEFIVSDKKFVEYQLDGWDTSKNRKLDYFYARNPENNSIVAYGLTMARQPSLLPEFLLPREELMVYTVIPREYHLKDLQLIGKVGNSFCAIQLAAK